MLYLPPLLCNAFLLHKDTMSKNGAGLSDVEVNQNLRVMSYNSFLSDIGYKKGSQVWWTAIIKLDEGACTNKFTRKKFLLCPESKCLVLCLDLLLEDSNYLEEEEFFEEVSNFLDTMEK